MIPAPLPPDEAQRLAALQAYDILDTLPEQDYDDIAHLASAICGTPIALVSLIDKDRQWFKARVGLDVPETHRDLAFCGYTILNPKQPMIVTDTFKDERFHDSPLVSGDPHIRFYAGAPLVTPRGEALGSLCVIDRIPRQLTEIQIQALNILSRNVINKLELIRANRDLSQNNQTMEGLVQKLSESNTELDKFAATAAHDMQEPLRTIAGLASFMGDEYANAMPADAKDSLEDMKLSVVRLQQLTRDLLENARANNDQSRRTAVDGNSIINQTLQNLKKLIGETGTIIRADELPEVTCNALQIMRVLQNLIVNAIKYQPSGRSPEIRILFSETDRHHQIAIQDNGRGIEPKYLEKIFQPFFRLDRKDDPDGNGIGLAICRKIAVNHGGNLWAESNGQHGSTFYLTIAKQ